jgi:hypothetical protein
MNKISTLVVIQMSTLLLVLVNLKEIIKAKMANTVRRHNKWENGNTNC